MIQCFSHWIYNRRKGIRAKIILKHLSLEQDRPKPQRYLPNMLLLNKQHRISIDFKKMVERLQLNGHGTPFFDKENNLHAYLGIGIDIH